MSKKYENNNQLKEEKANKKEKEVRLKFGVYKKNKYFEKVFKKGYFSGIAIYDHHSFDWDYIKDQFMEYIEVEELSEFDYCFQYFLSKDIPSYRPVEFIRNWKLIMKHEINIFFENNPIMGKYLEY